MKKFILPFFYILLTSCSSVSSTLVINSTMTQTIKFEQTSTSIPFTITPNPSITPKQTISPTPSHTVTLTSTTEPSSTSTVTKTPTETEVVLFLKDIWSENDYLGWMAHVGSWVASSSEYFRHDYPGIPILEVLPLPDDEVYDYIYWAWFYEFYETVPLNLACKWAYDFITITDEKILEENSSVEKEKLKLQFLRYSGDPEKVTYCPIFENLK